MCIGCVTLQVLPFGFAYFLYCKGFKPIHSATLLQNAISRLGKLLEFNEENTIFWPLTLK